MLHDRYGMELSTGSSVARDAYVHAVDAVLSATGDAEALVQTSIQADPEFALSYAVLARIQQLSGRMPEAKASGEKPSNLLKKRPTGKNNMLRFFSYLRADKDLRG